MTNQRISVFANVIADKYHTDVHYIILISHSVLLPQKYVVNLTGYLRDKSSNNTKHASISKVSNQAEERKRRREKR